MPITRLPMLALAAIVLLGGSYVPGAHPDDIHPRMIRAQGRFVQEVGCVD